MPRWWLRNEAATSLLGVQKRPLPSTGSVRSPVTEGWLGHVIEIQGDLGKKMHTAALRGSFWSTFQNIMARFGLRWDAWIPYLFIGMRHTSVGIVVVGCGHKRSLESVVSGLKEKKKKKLLDSTNFKSSKSTASIY